MMKIKIIDLEDYGHSEYTRWSYLTEDQKYEIRDCLIEQMYIDCFGSNH